MADKYLRLNAGVPTEVEGTIQSAGAADAGKIPALDSTGKLDETLLPVGIGADSKIMTASENIAAGDFVSVWDDAGTPKIRKADASTSGKRAHGFCLAAITAGSTGAVLFEGTNTQVSGATTGEVYLSATTPGGFTSTPPTGSGNVVQRIGVAVAATEINFEAGPIYVLA